MSESGRRVCLSDMIEVPLWTEHRERPRTEREEGRGNQEGEKSAVWMDGRERRGETEHNIVSGKKSAIQLF